MPHPTPTIIRSAKRKRTVALHVEADGSLTVQAPLRTPLGWINAFIVERAGWIARRQKAQAAKQAQPLPVFADGLLVPYLGQSLRVRVNPTAEESTATDCLSFALPRNLSPKDLQAEIKTEVTLWYKRQARRVFAERMAHWLEVMEAAGTISGPARLFVTNTRQRWGSCNSKNEIRLSWRLILCQPDVLDYVIVHELAHIPYKNHGKRFWRLVEHFIPNAKPLRQQLRTFEKSAFQSLFV